MTTVQIEPWVEFPSIPFVHYADALKALDSLLGALAPVGESGDFGSVPFWTAFPYGSAFAMLHISEDEMSSDLEDAMSSAVENAIEAGNHTDAFTVIVGQWNGGVAGGRRELSVHRIDAEQWSVVGANELDPEDEWGVKREWMITARIWFIAALSLKGLPVEVLDVLHPEEPRETPHREEWLVRIRPPDGGTRPANADDLRADCVVALTMTGNLPILVEWGDDC